MPSLSEAQAGVKHGRAVGERGWPAGPGVWLRGSVGGGSHGDPGFLAGTGPWGALAVHQEARRGWAWGIRLVREHAGSAGGLGKCAWGPIAQK